MVSYTTIEAQVVFEILLVLVTDQIAITSQLGREVHLQDIGLFLRRGDRDDLEKEFLAGQATRDMFALFWEAVAIPEVEAFPCFQE